jgi:hypothetical protein
MAPPGVLDLSIRRCDHVIELGLAGDLDLATAHCLREAMAWLRFTQKRDQTIVIDTRALDFVAVAGYRALRAELVGPDGLPDPSVVWIVGPVITRFESALGTALANGVSRIPPAAPASRASACCSPTHRSSLGSGWTSSRPPRRSSRAAEGQAAETKVLLHLYDNRRPSDVAHSQAPARTS